MQVKDDDRLSVEVRGYKTGRTVIHLRLTGGSTEHGVYEASLELVVVEELAFTLPPSAMPAIIVAPNTGFNIKTNLVCTLYVVVCTCFKGYWMKRIYIYNFFYQIAL